MDIYAQTGHTKKVAALTLAAAEAEAIAKQCLDIETLVTRNSDALDFHEVSVGEVRAALEAAFQAGLRARG